MILTADRLFQLISVIFPIMYLNLRKFGYDLHSVSFDPVKDSSNIDPGVWVKMAEIIEDSYDDFDGFVILHGTDTMAYTASALSFMLENLAKPVILTGSQLPIGLLRTDGRENLITAIEIAAAMENDLPAVPEVCILFRQQAYQRKPDNQDER